MDTQEWVLDDFDQGNSQSNALIRVSGMDFFGITKEEDKQQKRNLVKAEQAEKILFDEWQPATLQRAENREEETILKSWAPFVERINHQKVADQIINDAHSKAEEIISSGNEAVDQIRKEAFDQGIEQAKNEMKEALQAATSVINVAREWRTDMMNQAEPIIMDLVKKMAQKMFGDGIVLDDITLEQHFTSVLESARALGDLRIYMNPIDAKTLGPDWREYQAAALGNKVEIISNESVKRGGCYIQGEWGTADALVETQLATILNQFTEVEQPEREESDAD